MVVDRAANELYVADGYVNHRVIVFDADDRRLQAALGRLRQRGPTTGTSRGRARRCRALSAARCRTRTGRASTIRTARPPPQFRIVHAVRISQRRPRLRLRSHERSPAGVPEGRHVRARGRSSRKETFGSGSVWDVGFSTDPEQTFLFINDGTNQQIYVLDRETLRGRQHVRRRRALGRAVLRRAQPRGELEGRSVHHRDLRGQARAEVRTGEVRPRSLPGLARLESCTCKKPGCVSIAKSCTRPIDVRAARPTRSRSSRAGFPPTSGVSARGGPCLRRQSCPRIVRNG